MCYNAHEVKEMARPKEFEVNRVLAKAIEVFHDRGYEATTMQDLVEAMGINRQSIYDTFGDKHALFLQALARYEEVGTQHILEILELTPSVKQALQKIFYAFIDEEPDTRLRGCLMTNSAVELAAHDTAVATKACTNRNRVEDGIAAALARAQANGEISTRHNPRALARFFFNATQGIRVTGKIVDNPAVLKDVIEVTLSVLDS